MYEFMNYAYENIIIYSVYSVHILTRMFQVAKSVLRKNWTHHYEARKR